MTKFSHVMEDEWRFLYYWNSGLESIFLFALAVCLIWNRPGPCLYNILIDYPISTYIQLTFHRLSKLYVFRKNMNIHAHTYVCTTVNTERGHEFERDQKVVM